MSDTTTIPPTTSWRDTLPDDLKSNPTLSTVPDVATLAKNHVNLQSLLGTKRTELPNDKWTPEQFNGFYNQLGRPETPDKYSMPDIKLPDGFEFPKEELSKVTAEFHKLGLSDKQAKGALDLYFSNLKTGLESDSQRKVQEKAATEAELRKDFGDKYEGKLSLLNAVLGRFGSPDLVKWAEESGAGNNAAFVKALVKVGETLMEDSTSGFAKGSASSLDPRAASLNQIEALKLDKNFMEALNINSHPGHQTALNQWTMLFKTAFPS